MRDYVLITRPEDEAEQLAHEIEQMGYRPLLMPLLQIEEIEFTLPALDDYQALIFTSPRAIRAVQNKITTRDMPIFTVGSKTAQAAKTAGYETIHNADGDVAALTQLINGTINDPSRPLLYLSAEHISNPLEIAGYKIDRLITYRAEPVTDIPVHIQESLSEKKINTALFFSARTAEIFTKTIEQNNYTPLIKAIKSLSLSDSVVKSLSSLPWQDVQIATRPTQAAMLARLRLMMSERTEEHTKEDQSKMQQETTIENAEEVISKFGGIRPMARKMNVPVTTVQGWKKRNVIPATHYDDVVNAAQDHNIDLSDILENVANENHQASANIDADPVEEVRSEITETQPASPAPQQQSPTPDFNTEMIMESIRRSQQSAVQKSTWVSVLLILLVVAAGAVLLWPTQQEISMEVSRTNERLDTIETKIDTVEKEQFNLRSLIPAELPANLDAKLNEIQSQAEGLRSAVTELQEKAGQFTDTQLNGRLETLEQQINEMGIVPAELTAQLATLTRKLTGLQQSVEGQEQLASSVNELRAMVGGMQGQMDNLGANLQAKKAEGQTALTETLQGIPQNELKAASMLMVMTQLRSSMNRSEPFADDLQLLKKLVGDKNPELVATIDGLAPKAESGVLTSAGLSEQFKGMAGDIVVASLKGEDISVQERAKARFGDLLKIEKDGELITGTDTQATVARAQKLLDSGDVQAAIKELQSLDGEAATAAQPWIHEAQMTMLAERLQTLLGQNVTSEIQGQMNGGALPTQMNPQLQQKLMELKNKAQQLIPGANQVITDEESGMSILPQ
jgi:uroporphyrinogen-III synthase/outer membrane murein-binding lipoprotein Lpp